MDSDRQDSNVERSNSYRRLELTPEEIEERLIELERTAEQYRFDEFVGGEKAVKETCDSIRELFWVSADDE